MDSPITILKNFKKTLFVDIDTGQGDSTVLLSGIGRSGTTWVSEIINYDNRYRDIFEPFHPYKVRAAEGFCYHQYVNDQSPKTHLVGPTKKILSGKFKSAWSDSGNKKWLSKRRMIKDVRTNLMLGWLSAMRPGMPIILLIRHPLAILNSWKKLNWGQEDDGEQNDIDGILQQDDLIRDFPLIEKNLARISLDSYLDHIVFLWCVLYYVPLAQQTKHRVYTAFYENLLLDPLHGYGEVFRHIGRNFDVGTITSLVTKPSKTNFLKSSFNVPPIEIVQKWKTAFNEKEISRCNEILSMFELDGLYDENGIPAKDL